MEITLIILIFCILIIAFIQIYRYNKLTSKMKKLEVGDILVSKQTTNPFENQRLILIKEIKKGSDNKWYVEYSYMENEENAHSMTFSMSEYDICCLYEIYKYVN